MTAEVLSAIPCAYEGRLVTVEGDISRGLPAFNIVGMANKTVSEARDRVRSALINSGFSFPSQKLTINLAPAALAKDGAHLDLPIALAVLILSQQLLPQDLKNTLFVGELSLDGSLRPIRGIINVVEAAKLAGLHKIFLPAANLTQASLINGVESIGIHRLSQLFSFLKNQSTPKLSSHNPSPSTDVVKNTKTDSTSVLLDHIQGQDFAKRAITIAVAGHHNILLSGPPGTGKTILARAAANLLPPLTPPEQLSVTKLHSLAGLTDQIITQRPFRAPHHTASTAAIIGGGNHIAPGEISLAQHGILFLDELPEYPRNILEALRQPLEDHHITISRANHSATYPANFMLIATMNPCPCGHAGDPVHPCTCSLASLQNYQKKLSGPLFDRFDMHLFMPRIDNTTLLTAPSAAKHEHNVVKNNITEACHLQYRRYRTKNLYNNSLSAPQISILAKLSPPAQQLLTQASRQLDLSARAYLKVIKVARSIADLAASPTITQNHLAEALSFRQPKPKGMLT